MDSFLVLDPDGDLILVLNEEIRDTGDDSVRSANALSSNIGTPNEELGTQPTLADDIEQLSQPATDPIMREVCIKVSSKHLILASTAFKAILQPNSQEGHRLRLGLSPRVPLPDDDPAALLILLNIIHGRFREVPHKVDLEMLTSISVLVDKYDLIQIAEAFTDKWVNRLKKTIPEQFDDSLLQWMCISHAFQLRKIWKHVTKVAQLHCEGPIFQDDLPIPESTIGMCDVMRLHVWS